MLVGNDVSFLSFFRKILAGGNSYWLTRFVILRLLGFVYAIGFLVAAQQLVPLIGEHGLTPASHFLESIQSQFGSRTAAMLQLPTLFWLGISDNELPIFAWIGFGLSLVVLAGYANAIILAVLWAMYLSIVHIGLAVPLFCEGLRRNRQAFSNVDLHGTINSGAAESVR